MSDNMPWSEESYMKQIAHAKQIDREKTMGAIKQQQIEDMENAIFSQEINGPFTQDELERFQMEEDEHRADEEEMLQELRESRDLVIRELEKAYCEIFEWQMTKKYSSECISNAQRRIKIVLKMIEGGRLW